MLTDLRSRPLTAELVDLAFPLARELHGTITPPLWREQARPRLSPDPDVYVAPGALVTALGPGLRALAFFDVDPAPSARRNLAVHDVVVLGRPFAETLARQVLGGLLDVASRFGCRTMTVRLTRPGQWLYRLWSDPQGNLFRIPVTCMMVEEPNDPPHPGDTGGQVIAFPVAR